MEDTHDTFPIVAYPTRRGLSPAMTLALLAVVGVSSAVVFFGLAHAMAPQAAPAAVDRSVPAAPELQSSGGDEVVATATADEPEAAPEAEAPDALEAAPAPAGHRAERRRGHRVRGRPVEAEAPAPAAPTPRRGLGRLTDDPLQDVDFGDGRDSIFDA